MKNFVQPGQVIPLTAPGTVAAGVGVLVGSIFGVNQNNVTVGQSMELATTGVFDMAKTAAEAWTEGAVLYWNDTTKALTTTASTNKRVGYAARAQLAADTVGRAYLPGVVTN